MNTLPLPCCSILGAVLFVWGVFCLGWGVCFLHCPPGMWERSHRPPAVSKEKDTKEKGGGCVFAFPGLAPSGVEHRLSGNTLEVLKSSTYNIHFKSHLVLRVLAWHAVRLQSNTLSLKGARGVRVWGVYKPGACDRWYTRHTVKVHRRWR